MRRTRRGREDRHGKEPARPWEMPGVRLAVFGLACLLVLSGETVRLAHLPIFATDRLGMGLGQFGALMAVAPLTELAAMPLAGVLADRIGLSKVLVAGFAVGTGGYLLFGGSGSVLSLYLGQVLHACMIAVVFGLGVTYAQRLSPGSAGLAGSVFFSAQYLSALTGSLLGSGGVRGVGLASLAMRLWASRAVASPGWTSSPGAERSPGVWIPTAQVPTSVPCEVTPMRSPLPGKRARHWDSGWRRW